MSVTMSIGVAKIVGQLKTQLHGCSRAVWHQQDLSLCGHVCAPTVATTANSNIPEVGAFMMEPYTHN